MLPDWKNQGVGAVLDYCAFESKTVHPMCEKSTRPVFVPTHFPKELCIMFCEKSNKPKRMRKKFPFPYFSRKKN